ISETAARMEAVRTGARPKTSKPASTKAGARRQKKRTKEAAPRPAEPPSKPDDSDQEATRGRTRHRERRGRSDSKQESARWHTAASSGGGDKGETGDGEGTVPVPQGGFDSVARNLEAKLTAICEKHEQDKREFDMRPGLAWFVRAAVEGNTLEGPDFAVQFGSLYEAVMSYLDALSRLDALYSVAEKLEATEKRVRQSAGPREDSDADATNRDDEGGAEGAVLDTPLGITAQRIRQKIKETESRVLTLTRAITTVRSHIVIAYHAPPPPSFVFPRGIAPPELLTSEGVTDVTELDIAAFPNLVAALQLVRRQLSEWKQSFKEIRCRLLTNWWVVPDDLNEALRERSLTKLVFDLAAANTIRNFLEKQRDIWKLQDRARVEADAQRRKQYEEASDLLDIMIEEERQAIFNCIDQYGLRLWQSARARVKHGKGPWMSPPNHGHCPEIRAILEAPDRPSAGSSE
ncbi:toxoplasma gondii family E protein, partial [Toxoplasma gondii CAST]